MSRAGEIKYPWTDGELLQALALRDRGLVYAEIGKVLRRSKSAVAGALSRIDTELAAAEKAGLLAVACLALVWGLPAQAETVRIMGSSVTLRPTSQPGALAEVEFHNDPSNGPRDNAVYLLDLDGLQVDSRFTWNAAGDADRLDLTPPEGVICQPDCSLTLDEDATGTVWLYDLNRVGM